MSQGANNGPSQAAGNSQFVKFSRGAAQRIAKVVRIVESGDRGQPGIEFDHPVVTSGWKIRLCKTTAAWARGTMATLQVWESGDPPDEELSLDPDTSEPVTLDAYNKCYDVAACVWVLVGKGKNGKWYLLEAAVPDPTSGGSCAAPNISGHDLTTISGYASNKQQALTHDENACLKWVDIEECSS